MPVRVSWLRELNLRGDQAADHGVDRRSGPGTDQRDENEAREASRVGRGWPCLVAALLIQSPSDQGALSEMSGIVPKSHSSGARTGLGKYKQTKGVTVSAAAWSWPARSLQKNPLRQASMAPNSATGSQLAGAAATKVAATRLANKIARMVWAIGPRRAIQGTRQRGGNETRRTTGVCEGARSEQQ